jgi:phosphoserine phosphatase RsbU/P
MTHQIRCAEVWGGIQAIDAEVQTASLRASLFSTALDGTRGGDIYYMSVCRWDYLTRIAIADLRGHGEQVSTLSAWVYDAMQARMNTTDGYKVLADLNGAVRVHGFEAITTAAVVGYHARRRKLYFSYAGHPPIYIQRKGGAWQPLPIESTGPANLPLGVLTGTRYDMGAIPMAPGDRLCVYTDGVTDCTNAAEESFGDGGLMTSLERHRAAGVAELKAAVLADMARHRGSAPPDDDVTLLVAEAA